MELFNHRVRNGWFRYKYCQFCNLLRRIDFDAIVDHLALTDIIKDKAEPTTTRIKRLLWVLSSYSFKLYKRKGSGQKHEDSNPHKIIHISLNMQNVLQTRYYNIGE